MIPVERRDLTFVNQAQLIAVAQQLDQTLRYIEVRREVSNLTDDHGIHPLGAEEMDTHSRMNHVARIALINYLLAHRGRDEKRTSYPEIHHERQSVGSL
jgi:hypothetical protein